MEELYTFLESARRRLWLQHVARRAALGLIAGSGVAVLAGLVFAIRPCGQAAGWMVVLVLTGLVGGVVAGLRGRPSLAQAALAIDRRARLKDRVHTALQLSSQDTRDPFVQLQRRDAMHLLRRQQVERLFPWRWPREASWAVLSLLAGAAAVPLVPRPQQATAMPAGFSRAVRAEAAALAEQLAILEGAIQQIDEEVKGPQVRQLGPQLRQILEQMQEQARAPEEAMLPLARMTSSVQDSAASFDVPLLRQVLRDLGEGLAPLSGFEPAADALRQGRFAEASQALEQLGRRIGSGDWPILRSGGLLEDRLDQHAQQAAGSGLDELRDSLEHLRDAVQNGSRGESQAALSQLARTVDRYGQRVQLGQSLDRQLAGLAQSRQNLADPSRYCQSCREGRAPCEGGVCNGSDLSAGDTQPLPEPSPSQAAGAAGSATMDDAQTASEVGLRPEPLDGQPAHGDSDIETRRATGAGQAASRPYREVYMEYRKIGEQALAEETVPLGHRQAIKRYFEHLHPDRVDGATEFSR